MAFTPEVLLAQEPAWGTWTQPTLGFPFSDISFESGFERQDLRHMGADRGLKDSFQGIKAPSGSFTYAAYMEYMGHILQGAGFPSVTTTQETGPPAQTTSYTHAFLPDDSLTHISLSLMIKDNASIAQVAKGVLIDSLQLGCQAGEILMISGDIVAHDEAMIGASPADTWNDGSAVPSIVASPTYFADTIGQFHFANAALTLGGTPTLDGTSKVMSVSGGTAVVNCENVDLEIANNYDLPHFLGLVQTPGASYPQALDITGSLEIDFGNVTDDHYLAMKAGTEQALVLTFNGPTIETGFTYQLVITLPRTILETADIPARSGDLSRRVQSVDFKALVNSTIGFPIGITLIDTQSTY